MDSFGPWFPIIFYFLLMLELPQGIRTFAHPGAVGCGGAHTCLEGKGGMCCTFWLRALPVPAIKHHCPQTDTITVVPAPTLKDASLPVTSEVPVHPSMCLTLNPTQQSIPGLSQEGSVQGECCCGGSHPQLPPCLGCSCPYQLGGSWRKPSKHMPGHMLWCFSACS